ncbi:hypothetical protein P7D22_22800, partial [Lichenihabitans sp. Uapishka_5]|uniref:lipopolysaccharide biosynthesis protein n=1 Tax=Lichenihabitans sp. Uapishka_5 TaxID=3037302 RepID=UPI0029E821B7
KHAGSSRAARAGAAAAGLFCHRPAGRHPGDRGEVSPQAVGAFVAARTLARTLVQATGLVTHALMPEMAAASGRGDAVAVAAIARLNRMAALALLVPGGVALIAVGPWLFATWTGGRLVLPPGTWPLIVVAALLHGLWLSRANLLLAVNRQAAYAGPFFLVAVATVGLAAMAARSGGLPAVAAATVLGEVAMVVRLAGVERRSRSAMPPLTEALAR